jgi:hypothetical protein
MHAPSEESFDPRFHRCAGTSAQSSCGRRSAGSSAPASWCRLGRRSFDMLLLLVKRAGEFLSKDELLATVWADVVVEVGSVHVHLLMLRKALGNAGDSYEYREWMSSVPQLRYRPTTSRSFSMKNWSVDSLMPWVGCGCKAIHGNWPLQSKKHQRADGEVKHTVEISSARLPAFAVQGPTRRRMGEAAFARPISRTSPIVSTAFRAHLSGREGLDTAPFSARCSRRRRKLDFRHA